MLALLLPNAQNVPLFKEKNEYRLFGATKNKKESNDFLIAHVPFSITEIQAAYSVTDKIGIMAKFITAKAGDFKNHKNDWGKAKYMEGAIGYYKPLKKHGLLEMYGGFGTGSQHHQYPYNATSDLSFTKLFVQPSIGYTSKGFDIAFSVRFCNLYFSKINYNDTTISRFHQSEIDQISQNKNLFPVEPALTIRAGIEYVKFQLQAVYSRNINNNNLDEYIRPMNITFGLYISVAKRFWKKETKTTEQ